MQQNKAGEFQIPNSIHHPDFQESASSEVNLIYQEINNDTVENDFKPSYDRLMSIGDRIASARQQSVENSNNLAEKNNSGIMGVVSRMIFYPEYLERQKRSNPVSVADLMQLESEVGAEIFGKNSDIGYVKFFNENRDHWFLYHEKKSQNGLIDAHTIHYEIQPNGILKTCDKTGPMFEYVCGQELNDFLAATDIYESLVFSKIYNKNTTDSSKKQSQTL